jgi:hypothetical protein
MINQKDYNISMKKIVRLTESELKGIMENCVTRALQKKAVINEHVDYDREIKLAQKSLCKFPLGDVGMRLEGTQFYGQFKRMMDSIVDLNNSLIKYIRGEK